ncbi:MAG TPA: ABC transporter ATP-binding protein [Stellaceae bacterium]|nr:ABC transporter ATP-binding protein [Stellaceae bacterium]
MSEPILTLRGIRKLYGDFLAVDDVSIDLGKGEFLTLLGPSGSGKTTTLLMIAGLVTPSGGQMLLDGKPLNPLPPYRRNVGVVFQNYALFPHMTVARNIAFPLEMRNMPRRDVHEKAARALSLVGLSGYEDRYPRQLSGGQQQRIAFARAMVFEPRLLLMDEPLGALDKKLREQMQLEIMRLHRGLGISIIYVTHDQEEALAMSDRIAVFNRGRIEQIGLPGELYKSPKNRFVAGFLGDSNFFPGTVSGVSGGFCLIEGQAARMRARNGEIAEQGAQVVVAVRPECMRLGEASTPAESENQVFGAVHDVIYLGQSQKYVVRLENAFDVLVYQPSMARQEPSPKAGDRVSLSWSAEDATTLRDEGGR